MSRLRTERGPSLLFLVKLCFSLGLVVYLFRLVDWERAKMVLTQSSKLPLFIAPIVLLLNLCIGAWRWRSLLKSNDVNLPLIDAYYAYLLGLFYSIFLPGAVGGDVIRVGFCVNQTDCSSGSATVTVLLERAVGAMTVLLIACCVYFLFPEILTSMLTPRDVRWLIMVGLLGLSGFGVLLLGRPLWMRCLPEKRVHGVPSVLRSSFLSLMSIDGRLLVRLILLSVLFQAGDIVVSFLLGKAMKLNLSAGVFFAVMPIVYLATILPISLGGLGVREGVLAFLLSRFDVPTSDAVTLSFLIYLNRMIVGSSGGLLQLIRTVRTWFASRSTIEDSI